MKMYHSAVLVTVIGTTLTLLYGCSNVKKAGCSDDVMCTQMFAIISVDIKDASGNPVTLDSVSTIRQDNSAHFTAQDGMPGGGKYVVLDDSYISSLKMTTGKFKFRGYKGGQLVIDEPYTISADCCHIKLEEGKKEITIP